MGVTLNLRRGIAGFLYELLYTDCIQDLRYRLVTHLEVIVSQRVRVSAIGLT